MIPRHWRAITLLYWELVLAYTTLGWINTLDKLLGDERSKAEADKLREEYKELIFDLHDHISMLKRG
jgi:hypothetical protein